MSKPIYKINDIVSVRYNPGLDVTGYTQADLNNVKIVHVFNSDSDSDCDCLYIVQLHDGMTMDISEEEIK